jgi:kanamycin kinase
MRPPEIPSGDQPLPADLAVLVGGADATCVWRNEVGGLTFRVEGSPARYLKWAPRGSGMDVPGEVQRLRWAGPFTPAPRVLDTGSTRNGAWLMTADLGGSSAVDPRWQDRPVAAARAIGAGLRRLHEALPVAGCPFDWSVDARLAQARAAGTPVEGVGAPPPTDRLVVCHGDACSPNTLLDDAGGFLAHVDFDASGVADRWADLAVATMSLGWNFPDAGDGLERELLDAYGVDPDPVRTDYYRRLWNAT